MSERKVSEQKVMIADLRTDKVPESESRNEDSRRRMNDRLERKANPRNGFSARSGGLLTGLTYFRHCSNYYYRSIKKVGFGNL